MATGLWSFYLLGEVVVRLLSVDVLDGAHDAVGLLHAALGQAEARGLGAQPGHNKKERKSVKTVCEGRFPVQWESRHKERKGVNDKKGGAKYR